LSRILLVEDEEHLALGLAFNLRNQGYEVEVVDDGKRALETLARTKYDLVILDVMLPGLDGTEVAKARRRGGDFTPILMLTAKGSTNDAIVGIDAGADDYMTKPFDLDVLLARIRSLLRRRAWSLAAGEPTGEGREGPERLALGGWAIDFKTLRARARDGEEVELSPKEAGILKLFAAHPGEVISRSRLLEEVWGLPGTLDTRTVDNFIMRLRRRFEAEPADPRHILSVRGVGYRFEP
jgi:DNA-binding response OmpR family regulator